MYPIPCVTASFGFPISIFLLFIKISPLSCLLIPKIHLSNSFAPDPNNPLRPKISPSNKSKFIF